MADPIRNPRLPLWRTVREAYVLTFCNLGAFVRIAWAWLLLLTALGALASWFFWPSHAAALDAGQLTSWVQVVTTTLSMTAGASIAVAWHALLLRAEAPATSRYLRLDGVVCGYLLIGVATVAPAYLAGYMFPGSGSADDPEAMLAQLPFAIVLLVLGAVFGIKLSPILPAIALGRSDVSLGVVWRATHWNWWRLAAGYGLTTLPPLLMLSLPMLVRLWLAGDEAPPETQLGFVVSNTQSELVTLVSGIFAISFLSLAFRHFFPQPLAPHDEAPPNL